MAAVLALLSSLLWGTSDFLGGATSRRLPVFAVYGASQVFGAMVLVVIAVGTGAWRSDPGYWPWAVGGAVGGSIGMLLFYRALAIGQMGIVAPLVGLCVLIPVTWGLVHGEQPTSIQELGIVLAIAGILLASGPELGDAAGAESIVLATLALVSFGFVLIAVAQGSQVNAVMTTTAMRLVTVGIVLIVLVIVRTTGGVRWRDVGVLATIGITDGGANLAFALATTMGLLTVTSVLASLYPVVTALLAAIVLHERLRPVQYVGVASAILGIVLVSSTV